MSFCNKTLISMTPVTRKLARMVGELNSICIRQKNMLREISALEDELHQFHLAALHQDKSITPGVQVQLFDESPVPGEVLGPDALGSILREIDRAGHTL